MVANLKHSGHLISVSAIFDTPNQHQFTPVVEIRRSDSAGVLNTILTRTYAVCDSVTEYWSVHLAFL